MQPNALSRGTGVMPQNWTAPHEAPFLARFLGKLVLDVLPAALASVIGGFLFTQYQFGHAAALRAAAEQVSPASAEMIQLVRDEHAAIVDYLQTQSAAEQSRLAAEDRDAARAMAAAAAADDATAARQRQHRHRASPLRNRPLRAPRRQSTLRRCRRRRRSLLPRRSALTARRRPTGSRAIRIRFSP